MTGFTFFENYYEAISDKENGLTEEEQGRLYNAMFAYMFRNEEPTLTGACRMAFNLIKPSLDRSKRNGINKSIKGDCEEKNGKEMETQSNEMEKNGNQMENKSNEMENEKSPFFENKEQEDRSKNNCSFVLSAGAREEDGLIEFLKAHPNVKNDVLDISEISFVDYHVLSQKISESEFLRKTVSLSWLIRNYRDIAADKYRDYEKRRRGARSETSDVLADMYRQAKEEDRRNAEGDSG